MDGLTVSAVGPETRPAAAALRGRQILIVEDEGLIALMLEDMLRDLGCGIAGVATNLPAAMRAVESGPAPDAVLLDLNLDGSPSNAVADALVARGLPFLIVTGYDAGGAPAGHVGRRVLRKPFLEKDLAEALTALIARPLPAVGP